jgi:hypothetical protein
MRTFILSITINVIIMLVAGSGISQHYYGGGEAIPLQIDSTRVTLRFSGSTPVTQAEVVLNSVGRFAAVLQDDHAINYFVVCSLSTAQGYDGFLDSLAAIPVVDLVEPYYRNDYDSAYLVGTRFCVAFQEDMTQMEIDAINDIYDVVIYDTVAYMPNVFVLRNTKATGMRMLELANMYYELDATRYSHPSFSVRPVLSSYDLHDYYADNQPHTKKVIGQFNEASVWDFAGLTMGCLCREKQGL